MSSATVSSIAGVPSQPPTVADMLERLGGVPLDRVLSKPAPGQATEADLIEVQAKYGRLYELADGVLVEKGMGFVESLLAGVLVEALRRFVIPRNLGVVSTPDGMVRLFAGLVRLPDVAFVGWDRLPDRKVPRTPIPTLAPDLVVEILSESNTDAEMERKRGEYFASGVQLIWEVYPETRTVAVYVPDGSVEVRGASQVLDGGDVLPGFTLDLKELFGELDRTG
jgi:Uma2 family endonuclease